MNELLKQHGWKLSGKCNCGGVLTLKFTKGPFLIKYQKKKELFKVYERGKLIQNLTHEKNIYIFLQTQEA